VITDSIVKGKAWQNRKCRRNEAVHDDFGVLFILPAIIVKKFFHCEAKPLVAVAYL
jgi:hypothetical protein